MVSVAGLPAVSALVAPFHASAVCSGPPSDHLEVETLVTTDANRWSDAGEPTLYLAGDVGIALAEVGRHWESESDSGQLCLWQVRLDLAAAVDLRRPEVRSAVGVPDDPRWFLDRGRCRELAGRFRQSGIRGLIVPSVAFLDQADRWNAVVFVDDASELRQIVRMPRPVVRVDRQP
jgi:RES domain-containing protein